MKTGRPPKPPGTTVHRNKPTYEGQVIPAEGYDGPVLEPLDHLPPDLRPLWDRLWRSPSAAGWNEADVPGLTRYCMLTAEQDWSKDDLKAMLDLEDRYGLNPQARRLLRWTIGEKSEPEEKPEPSAERRRAMKVVDGVA